MNSVSGFPLLPKRNGKVVTFEDIQRIQQEIDDEDARRVYFIQELA